MGGWNVVAVAVVAGVETDVTAGTMVLTGVTVDGTKVVAVAAVGGAEAWVDSVAGVDNSVYAAACDVKLSDTVDVEGPSTSSTSLRLEAIFHGGLDQVRDLRKGDG